MRGRERGQAKFGLVLWQCFRPSISTDAKVGAALKFVIPSEAEGPAVCLDGKRNLEAIRPRHIRFCRKWNRSLRSGRDDKLEGGGAPWHGWRWMDRVEKELIWTSLTLNRPCGTDRDLPYS